MVSNYIVMKRRRTPESEVVISISSNVIKDAYDEHLQAIVLVGSFSRQEEIFCTVENSITRYFSDVEFLIVLRSMECKVDRSKVEKVVEMSLMDKGIAIDVSIGITTENHLRRFKPYIFTIETEKYGDVVWGNSNILRVMPKYEYDAIDHVDGFILLNNRIVEQLILYEKIDNEGVITKYEIEKAYAQIANSLLAVKQKYRSLYSEKLLEFKAILGSDQELAGRCSGFSERTIEALQSLGNYAHSEMKGSLALDRWRAVKESYMKAWEYEGAILWGLENDKVAVLKQCTASLGIMGRVKEWAKVIRSRGTSTSGIYGLLFASWSISPRCRIFKRALECYEHEQDSYARRKTIELWRQIYK